MKPDAQSLTALIRAVIDISLENNLKSIHLNFIPEDEEYEDVLVEMVVKICYSRNINKEPLLDYTETVKSLVEEREFENFKIETKWDNSKKHYIIRIYEKVIINLRPYNNEREED